MKAGSKINGCLFTLDKERLRIIDKSDVYLCVKQDFNRSNPELNLDFRPRRGRRSPFLSIVSTVYSHVL